MIAKKFINNVLLGDALEIMKEIPDNAINLIITSPPYWNARLYGNETIGREENPLDYVRDFLPFALEIKRILHSEGSFYLNLGDYYFGTKGFIRNKGSYARKTDIHYQEHKIVKPDGKVLQYKQRLLIPERIAIGMQEQGWILRNNIIWEKPNAVPSRSPDRRYPVHESIFHFVKSRKYFFDLKIAKELNHHRDVIRCKVEPYKIHPASFPEKLIEPLILTTSKTNDLVFDPFVGSGTTLVVAKKCGRDYLGIDINPYFVDLSYKRLYDLENIDTSSFISETLFSDVRKKKSKKIL